MKINVDSIALSRDNRALYFAPLTGSELLCVDVSFVHAAMCSSEQKDCLNYQAALIENVQVVLSDKPITDGITTDEDGNVWLTALEHSSIGPHAPLLSLHCDVLLHPFILLPHFSD
jgi:sugar lactone lactonase YvrE